MSRREPGRDASKAADEIRRFNHNSLASGPNWQYPAHSYHALGSLAYLVRMLPQAIEQTVRPAMRTYEHGRLLIDGGRDADEAVRQLQSALTEALASAQALAEAVDRVHSATSPMGLDTRGMPEFEDDGGVDE
ncbi:hypothetical protein DMH25_08365 [Streptomyces sp. WAC 01325]|uniref:hypothetical protein n=1 Tax=Streptomyces sp. WAC 01325 TaxID=2203202 RepID=UPI000F86A5A9|nr:hypothetical protein [Streptomyces sp. WAC 01325]RSN13791.1 hypothetical protein DMH25_08365 [Streptomyces sp. WAC 01325]